MVVYWLNVLLVFFPILSARIHEREVQKVIDVDDDAEDIWSEIDGTEEPLGEISLRSGALNGVTTLEVSTSSGKKRFYFFTEDKVNWHQAVRRCRTYGFNLASIPDYEQDAEIINMIKKKSWQDSRFWVGATDLGENQLEYYWLGDGKLVKRTYQNWAAGEPNGGGEDPGAEHCVEINFREQWNDYVCNSTQNLFICEQYLSK